MVSSWPRLVRGSDIINWRAPKRTTRCVGSVFGEESHGIGRFTRACSWRRERMTGRKMHASCQEHNCAYLRDRETGEGRRERIPVDVAARVPAPRENIRSNGCRDVNVPCIPLQNLMRLNYAT